MIYSKNCDNCGGVQTYTTKGRLECSIKENWVCNNCSLSHKKKIYNEEIINNVVNLYVSGYNFSKISLLLKISKDNIKNILIDRNVWIKNRDNIKKEFTSDEINDIIKKYEEGFSIQKISDLYGLSKSPIKRVLKSENLIRKGYSNGKKIKLSECQITKIKDLYLNEFKNSDEIAKHLGLNKFFINKYLDNCGYRRNRSEGVSIGLVVRYRGINYNDYLKTVNYLHKYKSDVMKITRQQTICDLLNYGKRGLSGIDGSYHLDHKFSISEGFKKNISPEIIGNIKNLEFIPWEENVKKELNVL